MAEPTNTPMLPSTPVPGGTPRSGSPSPAIPSLTPDGSTVTLPVRSRRPAPAEGRPVVLHIGDPVKYNPETYAAFSAAFEVVRPAAAERERGEFARALRERRWGDFHAIFRPFWGTGGEMGRWDAELIDLLPGSVRVFASAGAGFDWADTELLGEKGILYCNSGLAAAEAVADFAVAMIISTFRHLPWCMGAATVPPNPTSSSSNDADDADAQAQQHRIFQACHAQATAASHNLRGHSLGLVGLGNIGIHIAAKLGCPAFGMRVRYFDVAGRRPAAVEAELRATFHDSLESLLGASDCVVLCTPALPGGEALVTAEVLAMFRPGARFVNVARGSLVDEEALADALESGRIAAAALDVHAREPRVNPRLVRLAGLGAGTAPGRVMLTCHNAGGTVETHVGFEELSMRNIMAVLEGGEAITPVNAHLVKRKG
ncbi:D-isomer specific 2-hydroxyacid dehydrogenase [Phialemonium atrogriseum]|uniref:D-isomer specific 2-hydroxyacid dehydrogenase n=1 Tax=Phialemonium atrogriseum TaxID=1093897 RepID=A0AAJ0BPP0_9PEZI|nr:D-isomer specific 2-hydroxyacid dehydrogenase [Phialemonium atrogriseum]KAK1762189.1 D-isomer specific 2-hydroxyacid dehydrogenase [Phialemonium atrogriseum]